MKKLLPEVQELGKIGGEVAFGTNILNLFCHSAHLAQNDKEI
jgi:hypothetical protein